MHEYLKLLGTNNQHKADHFLIYERDLMLKMLIIGSALHLMLIKTL